MTTVIIVGLLCSIVGFLINFVVFPRNIKFIRKFNLKLEKANEELYEKNRELEQNRINLLQLTHKLDVEKTTQEQEYLNQVELQKEKIKHLIEIKQRDYEEDLKKLTFIFEEKIFDLQMKEDELKEKSEEKKLEIQKEIDKYIDLLKEVQDKYCAAIEVSKRAEEEKSAKDFYRICLSQDAVTDIGYLKSIEKYLVNREVLSKLIYKNYYEKSLNMMIGRVIGAVPKTGIYKITNIVNNMSYVGQAVDIGDRWKTHTKRALGAEPITTNKLYPTMKEFGPENFTFEVVEELPRDKLNEREHYWIDFYKTQSYGLNIKG